ncbi:MAG: WYL domain-containing protein [Flavobacterium sp.]
MPNKTTRIHRTYKALQQKPISLAEMEILYQENATPKSKRQIQRDIKEVVFFLQENELLSSFYIQKVKFYQIEQKKVSEETIPNLSSNLRFSLYNNPISSEEKRNNLLLLNEAINTGKVVQIKKLNNDETGDNYSFTPQQIQLVPTFIVYHRNNYYLGGYNLTHEKISFYGIRQMEGLRILTKKCNPDLYKEMVAVELANRFGITNNIDSTIYSIKIEIAHMLSDFIKSHTWHHSQKFGKVNGKIILTLKCGINRELLGWLSQWMYNVKVIEPPILKMYFEKTLKETSDVFLSKKPLVYRNIFDGDIHKED